MRRKGEDGVAPARARDARCRGSPRRRFEGRQGRIAIDARASAEPIILGAQTLPDATVALRAEPGAPLHLRLQASVSRGKAELAGEGDLDAGAWRSSAAPLISAARTLGCFAIGRASARRRPRPRSRRSPKPSPIAAPRSRARSKRRRPASRGRNLKLTLDRTTLTGSLAFASPAGGDAARLDLDLATDSLDVDTLPSLAVANMIGDMDLSISLKAGSLHIARVGEAGDRQRLGGAEGGQERAESHARALERRRTLGGASLDMQGAIDRDLLAATGHLRADRLRDFAVLVSRLAPGEWSRILVDRADGALAGGADLRGSRRRRRRRGARHRFVARQRIGGRNPVHDRARSAVEGRRPRSSRQPRFPKLGRDAAAARDASRRRREAGAGISRSMRPADGRRATTSMRRPRSPARS